MFGRRPFRRRGDRLVVSLGADEAELVLGLVDQLQRVLDDPVDDDPAVGRLFPRAYEDPTAEEREREYRALVHPDLLRARLDAIDTVLDGLRSGSGRGSRVELELAAGDEQQWLGVLNDARLVLGSRLDLTEESTPADFAPGTPGEVLYAVYEMLTYLVSELLAALQGE